MRVFVTGATGFIGSAVVRELIDSGHEVVGLTRSDRGAKALISWGAKAHQGDLEDLPSLRNGAAASDGVIHLAFVHDFSRYADAGQIDRRAVEAMGTELAGSGRPLVITSGTLVFKAGQVAAEDAAPDVSSAASIRLLAEDAVNALAEKGVRASVVRLAPSVHGEGDHGFIPTAINVAREKGASAYIGDGSNRWPAVHRLDAARLFRLALEKGVAGAKYHGAAEEGIPFREIAEVIGERLRLPVVGKSPEESAGHFGWLSFAAGFDNPASSRKTQERLGWHPMQAGLLADLDQNYYFNT